ncbi:MAG TPA: hypothetical protein VGH29_10615 [Candidatus Binataceae bacterium]
MANAKKNNPAATVQGRARGRKRIAENNLRIAAALDAGRVELWRGFPPDVRYQAIGQIHTVAQSATGFHLRNAGFGQRERLSGV